MANEQNLKPFDSNQSRERARENGRKGGIAAGASRRKKADFRKCLNQILSCEIEDSKIKKQLEAMGLNCTYEDAINLAMIKQSLRGDSKAFKVVCDTLGLSTKTDDEIKADIQKQQLEIEKLKLENERLKAQIAQGEAEIYEGDGFVEALISDGSNTFTEAGDLIED